MFERKLYQKLLDWKNESNGRTALLLEGPRRVGKSTLVAEFARREYETHIIIDFYTASPEVRALFDDLSDLNYIFLQLQFVYHANLIRRRSCIVFDEVQLCPRARQAIKALVADGRYDYIETGSLISIRKNVKDILIPSEEKKLRMQPMDFEEFRWALGDRCTTALLRECYQNHAPVGQATLRKLMRDFRLYMLVGGMPQAVARYISANNLHEVDDAKRDILALYRDDFYKIDSSGRLSALFDAIPAQLMKNSSRYHVSGVLENSRAGNVLEQIAELRSSGTVLVAYHANDPGPGLSQNKDLTKFKLFVADTGLFVTLAFKDRDFTDNDLYSSMLNDKLHANLGYVYENVVAQTLAAGGHELFYHTFMNEKSRHNYEVDFLVAEKNKVTAIEVKSSGYKNHPSIDAFYDKYQSRLLRQILIHTKDSRKDGAVECIPIIMAQFI
ncbi:MAG: ATP-binding protein [Succinivibrionaceae bacterium]|nr:ATP-binding protein [Succinivibrionaceae bacterium]